MHRTLPGTTLILAVLGVMGTHAAEPLPADFAGIVVERVIRGGAAEKAGLNPGDLLESWSRPPSSGTLRSPFGLWEAELAQAPRGTVTLHGRRGGKPASWTLPAGEWGVVARPLLASEDLAAHERAAKLAGSGDAIGAVAAWESIALRAEKSRNLGLAYWAQRRRASALLEARRFAEAGTACARAAELARALGEASLAAQAAEGGARALERGGDWNRAKTAWEGAVAFRETISQDDLALASTLSSLAVVEWRLGESDPAVSHHRRALAIRERRAPESLPVASSLVNLSTLESQRGEYDAAERSLLRALSIQEKILPGSLDAVKSLNNLGFLAETRGDLASAQEYYTRALSIQERLEPRSPIAATLIDNLGNVARSRSDFRVAELHFQRALALREELAPGSLDVASSLNNLGILFRVRGDLARAQEHYAKAMAIYEKQAPASPDAATVTMNLGIVAMQRGDLATAEEYCNRSLALRERLTPGGLPVAASRTTLGLIAWYRSDVPRAEEHYLCARDIYAQHAPSSLHEAMALNNLGTLYYEDGRLEEAHLCHSLALGMKQRLAPGGLDSTASLVSLGLVARQRGQLDISENYLRRALEIRERLAPESLEVAECYSHLGSLSSDRGEWPAAETFHRRALAIRERLAPDSVREAETLHDLGLVLRDSGRLEQALEILCRALASLEAQTVKMGGPESARERFSEKHGRIYRDYMDLLLKLGRPRTAFAVSERSRARLLLEMLASRDLALSEAVPQDLSLDAEQVEADLARVQGDLAGPRSAADPNRLRELEAERNVLERKRETLREAIRRSDPRLGALRYPETLDLEGAFSSLDPGTLLLEFSVGERETLLFAVGPASREYAVFTLPVGGPGLRTEVSRFLAALRAREDVEALSTKLSGKLLGPAKERIGRARHLLVSPDGCLNLLPFGALRDPGARKFRYLAEAKPTACAVSLSLFSELKEGRGRGSTFTGAAFGDPSYPAHLSEPGGGTGIGPALLRAKEVGATFRPLRFARTETESVSSFGKGQIRVWLGAEATEERVRNLPRETTLVHFACHAFADTEFPLDSALVLTVPDGSPNAADDGLLHAWEIFEKFRVDADLVTLSACETALGKEVGGEGIIGLTRALHYAGARSVISSLWSVSDQSTAELMRRFYGHLGTGAPRDEALRLAQVDLIRGKADLSRSSQGSPSASQTPSPPEGSSHREWSHPFFWAGFQLYGDAR